MTAAEYVAIAAAFGSAIGTAVVLAARIIVAVLRQMLDVHRLQITALLDVQRDTARAIGELRDEFVGMRSRVDTLIEITDKPPAGHRISR